WGLAWISACSGTPLLAAIAHIVSPYTTRWAALSAGNVGARLALIGEMAMLDAPFRIPPSCKEACGCSGPIGTNPRRGDQLGLALPSAPVEWPHVPDHPGKRRRQRRRTAAARTGGPVDRRRRAHRPHRP